MLDQARIYALFSSAIFNLDSAKPDFFILFTIISSLITIEFRMTGRPEMISHIMTVVFIFILYHFKLKHSNIVWLLIPLQILWTNMHEAFGTGVVILVAFTAGWWFDLIIGVSKQESKKHLVEPIEVRSLS